MKESGLTGKKTCISHVVVYIKQSDQESRDDTRKTTVE